ncbi:hypothetical protein BH10BAC4_BH10BAC4_18100 [soil metagenome]
MKLICLICFMCAFALSVHAQAISSETMENFEKVKWLEGTWMRTNAKPGRTANERWERSSAMVLRGWGVNMKGRDTVFVEKISIVIRDNALYYVADVPENKQPVFFKFIELTNNGFVCENPTHDFPKKIAYLSDGTQLKATISGDGKSIEYLFKRK